MLIVVYVVGVLVSFYITFKHTKTRLEEDYYTDVDMIFIGTMFGIFISLLTSWVYVVGYLIMKEMYKYREKQITKKEDK